MKEHKFEIPIDKYKHKFYTYHQGNTKDPSSSGVAAPSDRSLYITSAERSPILSHIFQVISSVSARSPVVIISIQRELFH